MRRRTLEHGDVPLPAGKQPCSSVRFAIMAAGMRLDDLIRGPRRPTQAQLSLRRRRVGALVALAALALALGALVGSSGGGHPQARPRGGGGGFYRHLRALAGTGHGSLAATERGAESAAIDRTLARTPFVRLAGTQHRLIALTFDDGPGPYTDGVIDALQRLGVPGTFFVVGSQIASFGAATLQRQAALGLPVGDHTQGHANLRFLPRAGQRAQIVAGARSIAAAGAPYPRLFRPPYGAYDQTTHALLRRRRMLSVLWSVDSEDYTKPGAATIARNVIGHARPGSIVLLHDAGGNRSETIAALPAIVRTLRREGYGFVTIPRLLLENPAPRAQQLPPGFNSNGAG
jgi:peptidoglycan/xylan/chitin deacetylase (PgdA/CDA1 family)